MTDRIRNYLSRIRSGLKCWDVLVGKCPRTVAGNAVIFFPLRPAVLSCGLTGIVTIRKGGGTVDEAILDRLHRSANTVEACGLKALLDKTIAPDHYCGGASVIEAMERDVLTLKQDRAFEHFFHSAEGRDRLFCLAGRLNAFVLGEEVHIETRAGGFSTAVMESVNNALIRLKDIAWGMERDILANLENLRFLAAGGNGREVLSKEAFRKYRNLNLLVNALDRLEVRGRDSAGLQLSFTLESPGALDRVMGNLEKAGLLSEWETRCREGDLRDGSIRVLQNPPVTGPVNITLTYKKASVTGELGENGRYLRSRIRYDRIIRCIIDEPLSCESYLGHTRWASVGSITEENCHPINNFTHFAGNGSSPREPSPLKRYPRYGEGGWTINAALNGDIDNYASLRAELEEERGDTIGKTITTDTKIIPLRVEKYLMEGEDLCGAFRRAVNDFEGSHAIALASDLEPDRVFLALRGSGQSLYLGLCENQYMFSSELYGLVELTPHFIKMDGEEERIPGDPATKGQIFVLGGKADAHTRMVEAFYYDGHPLPVAAMEVQKAEITTRDIDRKDYPHYLLKEILEAPLSVRKTLRGKYQVKKDVRGVSEVAFNLGSDILSPRLREVLRARSIVSIRVIGQGTAAVAGAAIAGAFSRYLRGSGIAVESQTSSELSGFALEDDLTNTLVIAVTQSGTTTDTNRAVSMAKERGAHLIAIVNRRQSDITHVADGVFYTSDGRDIEMSVASTKAFYSQIVAGYILALNCAQLLGTLSDERIASELSRLETAPARMETLLSLSDRIRESAWELVKKKRYWAVVGSGPNKVAADEIRIKLSELCYKTISSDIVEDKKHIDLSSEPLVVVCAAGNPEPVVEDIAKDVAIFKAHAAAVVVFADEGEHRFDAAADSVVYLPVSSFPTSVILNTLAGHIWGYHAACSINEEGQFFRSFRNRLSLRTGELDREDHSLFEKIADTGTRRIVDEFAAAFNSRRNRGFFSSLSVEVASDIALLLKYAVGKLPLEDFWQEFEEKRPSSSPLDMLDITLGRAIDELARPIDAIRHQAKTVTVGTSRKGEMLRGILFDFLRGQGFSLENLTSKDGFTARRLQKVLSDIQGYTLYGLQGLDDDGRPVDGTTIALQRRDGLSLHMKSRYETPGLLKGTKKSIVSTGDIYAGLGKSDGAPVVIIPLLGEDKLIHKILLLHVEFRQDLSIEQKREVMGDKYHGISDIVTEYNLPWDDGYLESLPVEFLLGEGVGVIASEIMKNYDETQVAKHDIHH